MELLKAEGPGTPSAPNPESSDNPADSQVYPVAYPPITYEASAIEPCVINLDGFSLPVHLLTCGHVVTIDSPSGLADNRCGLNCLHVAHWIRQRTIHAPAENIDLHTGTSLGRALTSVAPLQITKDPILPAITQHQSHENIFCEICVGLPASSYFIIPRDVKRALALTRPVIEHFTGLTNEQIVNRLCKPFYDSTQNGYDWKLTHILRCGHEVWVRPARPCAANCSDSPECKHRIFSGNEKQGDVIFCHECVYRAEMVYERYAQVGKGIAQGVGVHMGSCGMLAPEKTRGLPQPQVGSTYGVATPRFSNHQEYMAADGLPLDLAREEDFSIASAGAGAR